MGKYGTVIQATVKNITAQKMSEYRQTHTFIMWNIYLVMKTLLCTKLQYTACLFQLLALNVINMKDRRLLTQETIAYFDSFSGGLA